MWRVQARRASWLTFLLKSEKALTLSDFSCQQITQSGENLEPQASAARDFHSLMLIQCIRIFAVSLIRKDKRNGRLRFYGADLCCGCGARRCRASPALAQKVQFLSSSTVTQRKRRRGDLRRRSGQRWNPDGDKGRWSALNPAWWKQEDGKVLCERASLGCRGGWRVRAGVWKGKQGLTGANVELWAAYAVVAGWTVVETFPVLPHPLPPQKQEEFGLAVHAAVVSGAHGAAFTDGVRSIASCGRKTRGVSRMVKISKKRVSLSDFS